MSFTIPNAWCVKETEKAIACELPEVARGLTWIPKSQITDDSEVWKPDQDGDLVVTDWYAEQKEWT